MRFKLGDLVKMNLRGRLSTGRNYKSDETGMIVSVIMGELFKVHWFETGITSIWHPDFIEPINETTD